MTTISDELRRSMSEVQTALARSLHFMSSLASVSADLSTGGGFHPPVPPIQRNAQRLVDDSTELVGAAETLRMKCLAFHTIAGKTAAHDK